MFVLLLVACKAPPDAPDDLNELVGYLYAHAPDDDPAALEAGAVNLDEWLVDGIEETQEGYTVDNLSDETVDALGEGDRELTNLAGAAVGHISAFDVEALVSAQLQDDMLLVYPGTYVSYEREDLVGDTECFVTQECLWYEGEIWTEQSFAGITVKTNSRVQFRWVETPDGLAMLQRNWTRAPAEISVEWLAVDQQYYLWMLLPEGDGARQIQSMWVVATISDDQANPDFALTIVINNLQKMAEDLDAWVAAK